MITTNAVLIHGVLILQIPSEASLAPSETIEALWRGAAQAVALSLVNTLASLAK
jgi:hypothetical protein